METVSKKIIAIKHEKKDDTFMPTFVGSFRPYFSYPIPIIMDEIEMVATPLKYDGSFRSIWKINFKNQTKSTQTYKGIDFPAILKKCSTPDKSDKDKNTNRTISWGPKVEQIALNTIQKWDTKCPYIQLPYAMGTDQSGKTRFNLFPYTENRDLGHYLAENTEYISDPTQHDELIFRLGYQMAYAIDFIHQHDLLHGDTQTTNFLVFGKRGEEYIKLTDFEFAKACKREQTIHLTQEAGTHGFQPPELLIDGYYSQSQDNFGLGISLFEAYFKENIYETANCEKIPFPTSIPRVVRKHIEDVITQKRIDDQSLVDNGQLSINHQQLRNRFYDMLLELTELERSKRLTSSMAKETLQNLHQTLCELQPSLCHNETVAK